jgi:hypothetical protein
MSLNSKDTQNQKRLMKPLFLVPTKESLDKAAAMTAALEIIESDKEKPCVAEQKRAAFEAESNRLVKRTESPTGFFSNLNQAQKQQKRTFTQARRSNKLKANSIAKREFEAQLHTCPEPLSLASRKTISKSVHFAGLEKVGAISNESKTCVRMYHQEWSGNYRLGLETGALGSKSTPPTTTGERFTESLSSKAVLNILESGAYLSACRGGYTTFLTLTFDDEACKRVLDVVAIPQGKVKNYKWGQVRCVDGVPVDYAQTDNKLDIEKAENIKGYCNAIPASGAFSSVEFKPVSSIGKEVSRFFDASQKMYQRGWLPRIKEVTTTKSAAANMVIYSGTKKKVKSALPMICPEFVDPFASDGETFDSNSTEAVRYNPRKHNSPKFLGYISGQIEKQAPLDYMWVAEMPESENREKNPHVHVMMRWQVEQPVFRAWAERLESIWGHGFAKLERIKTPQAASNYLLKAVGYLAKGSAGEQGIIRGNRYGISASARAPKWECIGEFYSDNFLAILGELREKLHRKKAKINAQVIACTQQRTTEKGLVKKLTNINKKTPTEKRHAYIEKMKARMVQGDKAIKDCQEKSHNLPFINDFAIGNLDENQAVDFISWAMRSRFWNGDVKSNRYNTWEELKASTIEAVKENRRYWYNYAELLETSEITWLWAEQRSNYEVIEVSENITYDQNGREWEQVA